MSGSTDRASFEALMRDALLGAATSVWEWDVLSDELHGSDTTVHLLGYPPEQVVRHQQAWNALIHPDDVAENDAAYQRHARGETEAYEHEYRARAHDGQWRWLSERGRIVEWTAEGQPARMVGTLTDITPRRRAEGRVLEMAERLQKIARHVPGIVFQFCRSRQGLGSFPYVSESCLELTGLPPQALMDNAEAMLRLVAPSDRAALGGSIEQSMRSLRPWRCEFRLLRPDGQLRWMAGSASPQRESDGSVLWHGYIQDVTDLHELDQARQARTVAEAANRAKSDFLSRMSHELRTPLNAVLGFAQLLELDDTDALSATQRRRVGLIRDAGTHLLNMIGELLDLTRIESGHLVVRHQPLALDPLLRECVDLLRPQAGAAQVQLQLSSALMAGPDAPLVRGDATRLRQVVLNLLGNAIKYNRPGGRVDIAIEPLGGELALHVVDTGVGIAAADLEHVFEPFNRGAHQRSAIEGAGIGLAVTRGLVALMHGRVEVRSTPGVGSRFSVILPAAEPAP